MTAKKAKIGLQFKFRPNDTLLQLNERGIMSRRAFNVCQRLGLRTCQDIIDYLWRSNISHGFPHYGAKTVAELKSLAMAVETDKETRSRSEKGMIIYGLSQTKRKMIERHYSELISSAPTIVSNFAKSYYPSFFDTLDCSMLTLEEFTALHGGKRKSSSGFYTLVLEPAHKFAHTVGEMNETSAVQSSVRFPFLSTDGVDFVASYLDTNGTFPMFHIIYDYILQNNHRDVLMFRMKHGMAEDKAPRSLDRIASHFGLTRERVRQITTNPTFLDEIDAYVRAEGYLDAYRAPGGGVCFPHSHWYVALTRRERLPEAFSFFAEIYCHYFNYRFCNTPFHSYIVAADKEPYISSIIGVIEHYRNTKHRHNMVVNIYDILDRANVPEGGKDEMARLLLNDIVPALGITVKGQTVVFEKNTCHVEHEVIEMLRQKGSPIHFKDIVTRLRDDNPELTLKDASIKYILQHSDHITSIGKTSRYTLREWTHVFTGGIRQAVRQCLCESSTPVPINQIVSFVLSHHPDTKEKNIVASISQSHEFIRFEDNAYGLAGREYSRKYKRVQGPSTHSSFEERFDQYRRFVEKHGRHPYQNENTEESSLSRWRENVLSGKLMLDNESVRQLLVFIEKHRHIPQNGREHTFLVNCFRMRRFVEERGKMPCRKSNNKLYNWYIKNAAMYRDYGGNRTRYFEQLLADIGSE